MASTLPSILLNLPSPISAFAFNADQTQVAICPNNELVHIYNTQSYTLTHTLAQHTHLVTGIDWGKKSNRLVTCSQDRNGYVWTFTGSEWTPELVMLRINRGATSVKWSPNEDKFAVASNSKLVSICYFDTDNDWWSCKHLKKPIASTVLSIAWHPNNVLLAIGSADNHVRVISAFIKSLDLKPTACVWGDRFPFGTVCADIDGGAWIHSVAFSPLGDWLAFVAHDSSFHIYSPAPAVAKTIFVQILPLLDLIWINESQIIAVGHECTPVLFAKGSGDQQWQYVGKLNQGNEKKNKETSTNSALAKFKSLDSRAQSVSNQDADLMTLHQNSIISIQHFTPTKYVTAGIDGRIIAWDCGNDLMKQVDRVSA